MTDEQPPTLPGFGHHRDELPGDEDNKPELAKAIKQADQGRWILVATVAIAALLIAVLYPYFSHLSESKYNKAQDKAITAGQQAASGKALASALASECKDPAVRVDLGGLCSQASSVATQTPPVAVPTRTLIIPGPQGLPATNGQIQAAVTVYLAAHPPPIDYSILRAFVNSYLIAHPAPRGQSGQPGASGSPGQTGQPGGNGPSGPSGPAGADGTSGTSPPSIKNIDGSITGDVLTLVFTLSNDTSLTATATFSPPNGCPATQIVTVPPTFPALDNQTITMCVPAPH